MKPVRIIKVERNKTRLAKWIGWVMPKKVTVKITLRNNKSEYVRIPINDVIPVQRLLYRIKSVEFVYFRDALINKLYRLRS